MEYWLVIRWLVVYLLLLIAGVPITAVLCPRLENRGVGIALPVALASIGLPVYWIGQLTFGWVSIGGGVVALVVVVLVVRSREAIEIDRRPVVEAAVVFTISFLGLVIVRSVDPGIHPAGGEKFLDYGLLASLLRASALPPEDFWFAGESVQYYYGGHMLSAVLSTLTGTTAPYGYNLALAGWYAMLVTGVYGLAGSLGASVGLSRWRTGVFGGIFVGVASNLQTPVRALLWLLPDETAASIAKWLNVPIEGLAVTPANFSYWNASRVIPGVPTDPDSYRIATEFPLFAWLNGDLHAHMMSTPFLVVVTTLCFSYYRSQPAERSLRTTLLATVGVLSGLIGFINMWSFPTALGVAWLTLLFASPSGTMQATARRASSLPPLRWFEDQERKWFTRELQHVGRSLLIVGGMALVGVAATLPFWLGPASGRAIGLVSDQTPFGPLFLVHGGFLLVFVPVLVDRSSIIVHLKRRPIVSGVVVGLSIAVAAWLGFPALVVIGPIVLWTWARLRAEQLTDEPRDASLGYPGVLVLAGAGIVLLVELLYLQDQAASGRFNTVFKAYFQVWVLWSPAAGVGLIWLFRWRPRGVRLGRLLVAAVVLSTAIYGPLALSNHFTGSAPDATLEDPTLDGLTHLDTVHSDEATAIRWLNRQPGQPVVAAAPGKDQYSWVNPESALTGLPTIVGWTHEIIYRNASVYNARAADVDTLYQGPPERTIEQLQHYDVRYIYVGPRERQRYDERPFDRINGLEKHRFGDVTIYEVNQTRLTPTRNLTAEKSLRTV
ncbi:DUF2298 domain-containing protein [Halocatena salina]|uniref:DUF2298 domain-containing protein n=1 Tax=Halocatena salina TaxID=2934340 RepID=A0A8U0A777_9EURY|nr:DUF2298 domain-containing protein [Halocatena salina]UPM43757.1 DUF2298 domain-containing protein [Halocatena salina]